MIMAVVGGVATELADVPVVLHVFLFSFDLEVAVLLVALALCVNNGVDFQPVSFLLALEVFSAERVLLHFLLEFVAIGLLALALPLGVVLEAGDAGRVYGLQWRQHHLLSLRPHIFIARPVGTNHEANAPL